MFNIVVAVLCVIVFVVLVVRLVVFLSRGGW